MQVTGKRCYTRYKIGTEYDFGCPGYWWQIRKTSDGKYVVQMNGMIDKKCDSYLKACKHMDKIKECYSEV